VSNTVSESDTVLFSIHAFENRCNFKEFFMIFSNRSHFVRRELTALILAVILFTTPALGWQSPAVSNPAVGSKAAPALAVSELDAVARLKVETITEITTALASKEMEGRGTATPGGERAAQFIADRFAKLGLKPLGDGGKYLQAVKFKSAQPISESTFKAGDSSLNLGEDYIITPFTSGQVDGSGGLVFVGYGVVSPELKRDDLAGLDLKNKVVVILTGRPKNIDEAEWAKVSNPQKISSNLLGRGIAGLVIANYGTKEEPFSLLSSYLMRRRVRLADTPETPFKLPPIVLASSSGVEKLMAGTGSTFAQVLEKAENGENVTKDLNKTATISLRVKNEEATGSNVAGVIEGSDPKLKEEAVIFTAHYDAYGLGTDGTIYPGAADNALGVGMMLSIAEAMAKSPVKPRRSTIFLAVTGEEHGLLGASYWVKNPTWPIDKLAANINFDGIGTEVYGPVKRVTIFGGEYSELGSVLSDVVVATGNTVLPDPMPEEKTFYRSDHYAFVKKGVPAVMLMGSPEGDAASLLARVKKWLKTDYHQATDVVRPDWHWEGARTLASVGLIVGLRVANTDVMPAWLPTAPFNRETGNGGTPK
jgi:hypothetical protein